MFCRFIAASLILLTASVPASALTIKSMDEPLAAAAARMKVKDFTGAREAAIKSTERGSKAFLLGMSDIKLELWEEAASQLAYAADNYPILADYALYNQGLALSKLNRADDALPPLYKLLKQYPDSRLARPALILYADMLAAGGHAKEALDSYTMFIERYASGSDAISAVFGSAQCRERLGDPKAAAATFRGIWLTYPASPFAAKAAAELGRLAAAGTAVDPYTPAELFKRGSTLYNTGKYKKAIDAFAAVPTQGATDDFVDKLQLKLGQAQFKARRYQDAQTTLKSLSQKGGSVGAEAGYWLGRTIDKSGNHEEAFNTYLRLADSPKAGAVADDALLEAAYLRRFQHRWAEAAVLFKRFLASYPNEKNGTVTWEAAWACYECRDYAGAANYFRKLAERDEMREKALYWLGKSVAASGDTKGAEVHFAALASEYPFGFYTLLCNRWCDGSAFPAPPKGLKESLPMPAGFEREKALIALGLYDEAGRELNVRKKSKSALGVARLYLEMGNYNGAYHAAARETLRRQERESSPVWGLNYPLAYNEDVAKHASANALPESLVYAIMRTESNYFPAALSPVGAVGLMQIMPATAERIAKGESANLTRPELNIRLGAKHLKYLLSMYDKNLTLTIAAYNAGSGNVKRWQKNLAGLPQDEFIENIPFRETREYVKKVLTAMELYQRLYRMPEQKKGASKASTTESLTTEQPKGTQGKAPETL